jgi:YwiC-like protein
MSAAPTTPSSRAAWRAVALPTEHGGWGLTLEPALLGVLVAPSGAGVALALAAFLAFLARTPLKVVLVDRHRHRRLERTRTAAIFATVELASIAVLVAVALALAGATWMIPLAAALPLFGVELWYDARSRSRRLLPELCGAVGIAAVVSAIVLADGRSWALAGALWLILTARAVASVTFARGQVLRLRHGATTTTASDLAQLAGLAIAIAAWLVDPRVALGAVCVLAVVTAQFAWSRGPARAAKVVGIWQMVFGLVVVAGTAAGVVWW